MVTEEADFKKIAHFFYETGNLKRVKRSGWWTINVKDPESVADHSFRTAVIGYVLAQLEHADAEHVTSICLFHDVPEARLNDLHKVGQRYINFKEAETNVYQEQTDPLGETGKDIFSLHQELNAQKTKEALIARDADLLESLVQAREYGTIGYSDARDWITNAKKHLVTESAKKLAKELEETEPNEWWQGLKNIQR